jgi:hypothetical protein
MLAGLAEASLARIVPHATFTYIVVVAIAAFIPYAAAPGIVKGVKAISSPPVAVSFEAASPASSAGSDAADQIVSERRNSEGSV